MTPRERFHHFFAGIKIDRPLVHPLCMKIAARQVGRFYKDYVQDAEVLANAQITLAKDYGIEVVTVCSDPVRELADMGGDLVWFDDDPPMADPNHPLIVDPIDLDRVSAPDPYHGRMGDRVRGVALLVLRGGHRYPVQGWVEGPISFAAAAHGLTQTIEDLIDRPEFMAELFRFATDIAIRFAEAQIAAGADIIGFGDAPASLLNLPLYDQYVLPEEKRLIRAIHAKGAIAKMHICGNTSHLVAAMGQSGADLIDLDSAVDLNRARVAIPPRVAILGNLDPVRVVRDGSPDRILKELRLCQTAVGPRYVIGAGCEIPADTPPENLLAMHTFADLRFRISLQ